MNKLNLVLFFCLLKVSFCSAQSKMILLEDSLKNLGKTLTSDSIEENRIKANYTFIKTLVNSLKEKNSFAYPYNALQSFIAIKKSEDNKFRIFSWFTQNDDGTYRFYGAIQMNNPNQLELYPLIDDSQDLKNNTSINQAILTPNQWLGSVYYHILPVTNIKNPYYVLLGWKGKNNISSSKIIETLSFKDGKPVFGTGVLEDQPKSNHYVNRIIFDYTKDASMLLRYSKEDHLIVFDHLVNLSSKTDGLNSLMAPDLSYDGYKFKLGKWIYQDNLKLKNLPDTGDELFIDPAKDSQNTKPAIKN